MPIAQPLTPFRCPICRSRIYVELPRRPHVDGSSTRPVFECAGCSVLFRDPGKFTRFEPASARIAAPDFQHGWIKPKSAD